VAIVREPDGRVVAFQDISASMFDVRTSEPSAIHLINMRVTPNDPNTVNDETEVSVFIRYGGQGGTLIFEYACDNTLTTVCPATFEPGDQVRGVLATGGEGALRRVAHQSAGGFDVYLYSLCPLL
jgi:signal transduction histidine kinase